MNNFITVLAWIICPLSFIFIILCIAFQVQYNNDKLAQALDRVQGRQTTYIPAIRFLAILFILSLAWLLSYYLF